MYPEEVGEDRLKLVYEDNGVGIPEEKKSSRKATEKAQTTDSI